MLTLETDITNINRVGAATAKKLKKLGILAVRDLLLYFPFRYDDFTKITPVENLRAGLSANVVGQIELIQNKRSWKRRMNLTEALISDGAASLKVIWFNQPFITRVLRVGDKVSLAGKMEDSHGDLTMVSPVYEKIGFSQTVHTQGFVPNYHLTANLTHKQIRFLIKQVMVLADKIADWLPPETKSAVKLISLPEAIKKIHFPKSNLDIKKARERLAFQELFLIQLQSQLVEKSLSLSRAPAVAFHQAETKQFVDSLSFKLTDAQRKAAWEILRDLAEDRPMSRLLEGDVGSGKTIVAIMAMLNVALNKKQAVLMVPTEILAKQHYETVSRLLSGLGIKIGLVTRTNKLMSDNEKSKLSAAEIVKQTDIIIGTHALIQEEIKFNSLALAVIDEQHRFGVEQRQKLAEKTGGEFMPHLLSMTATPIPRSLALALYGDLNLSVIDEMPKDRKPIITRVVAENKRHEAYKFIHDQVREGRQIFVICPLIDLSDKLGVKSVEEEYQKLAKIVFPGLSVGKLHGRLKQPEKEKIMRDFLDNKIQILVSTSVVEVGVDVPNASVMMIEGADRFGLAQIHQFRGRVGRSVYQSYCFLFSDNQSETTSRRLQALVENHNGFDLAKLDLKFRGPGEVYGLEQKGFPELKMATLFDYALIRQARAEAKKLIKIDSSLNSWPNLKKELGEWDSGAHLE